VESVVRGSAEHVATGGTRANGRTVAPCGRRHRWSAPRRLVLLLAARPCRPATPSGHSPAGAGPGRLSAANPPHGRTGERGARARTFCCVPPPEPPRESGGRAAPCSPGRPEPRGGASARSPFPCSPLGRSPHGPVGARATAVGIRGRLLVADGPGALPRAHHGDRVRRGVKR